jgi:hypothetical protein
MFANNTIHFGCNNETHDAKSLSAKQAEISLKEDVNDTDQLPHLQIHKVENEIIKESCEDFILSNKEEQSKIMEEHSSLSYENEKLPI